MVDIDDTGSGARDDPSWRRWIITGLVALPLLLWWVSWYPGMLSAGSIDRLTGIDGGEFGAPAIYSIAIWLVTLVWSSPAVVTLLQVAAMVALLTGFVRRAPGIGVPGWLAGTVAVVFAWLPAVGATTIALEPQVPQTLVGIWLLIELMGLAPDPEAYLGDPWPQARLGTALALAWLLDQAGVVIVVVVAGALLVALRRRAGLLLVPLGGGLALALLIQGPLYAVFSVDRVGTPVGLAYAPEIAAVYHHDPGWFGEDDRALLGAVADLDVWEDAYRCGDGSALVSDREFDAAVIRARPGAYRGLLVRATATHPLTVAGNRMCAAGILFVPSQPVGEQFATYVYNVPPNDLGVERATLWEQGFNLTKAILVRVDQPGRLWLFWRPGIFVWPALAAALVLWIRRSRAAPVGLALAAYVILGFLTVHEPSFREVFSVYALAFLSLPLWWPAVRSRAVTGSR